MGNQKRKKSRRERLTDGSRTVPSRKRQPASETPASETSLFSTQKDKPVAEPPIANPTPSYVLLAMSVRLWLRNYNTAITLTILPVLVMLLGIQIAQGTDYVSNRSIAGALIVIAGSLWSFLNTPATYYMHLRAMRGERPTVWQCYRQGLRFLPRIVGLAMIAAIIMFFGLLAFIIPAFIFTRRYLLSFYYLIDMDLGIRESLQRSAADSKASAKQIWGSLAAFFFVIMAATALFTPLMPPYGSALSALSVSFVSFSLALRYKEVGLRKKSADDLGLERVPVER